MYSFDLDLRKTRDVVNNLQYLIGYPQLQRIHRLIREYEIRRILVDTGSTGKLFHYSLFEKSGFIYIFGKDYMDRPIIVVNVEVV